MLGTCIRKVPYSNLYCDADNSGTVAQIYATSASFHIFSHSLLTDYSTNRSELVKIRQLIHILLCVSSDTWTRIHTYIHTHTLST